MFVNAAIAVTFVTTSGAIKHCLFCLEKPPALRVVMCFGFASYLS